MEFNIQPLGMISDTGEQGKLGAILHAYVKDSRFEAHLKQRHLLGVLRRHKESEAASQKEVYKAYKLHRDGELGVFVLRAAKVVLGIATVDPTPKLQRLKLSVPPAIGKGPLTEQVPFYGPQVTAWVNPMLGLASEEYLSEAYRALKDPTGIAKLQYEVYRTATEAVAVEPVQAWTIEPCDASPFVRHAIKSANYSNSEGHIGYYDDGESRRHSPPLSKMYVAAPPLSVA